ncbi:hypothetical protein MMA231_00953 [Asticcacaulis sp. MM231]|uniref:glycoside hydrolase family 108 protein n=1 Tax=Asticcacaulis sp. MM231 TaxID=3157666 RepID=UPI0032D56ED7
MAGKKSPILTPLYGSDARFIHLAATVLDIEGGYSNHKSDNGGETQYGISLRFLKSEGKLIDLNQDGRADLDLDFDGDIDGADIRLLTKEAAKNLYYLCFWERLSLKTLPTFIDGAVLDQAINGGASAAVKMLQRACNRFAIVPDLKVDGDLGFKTRSRLWEIKSFGNGIPKLISNYRQEAEVRYNAIARADPKQVIFLDGWVKRARRLGDV